MNSYGKAAIAASWLSAITLGAPPAAVAADAACDRVCLVTIATRYLTALTEHQPASAPLAANVKFTENGKPAKVGEGSWQAAKGVRPQRQLVADIQAGQVGVMAVIDGVDDQLQVLAVRLKVSDGKITEIESLWSQDGQAGPAWSPEMYLHREPPFVREVPQKNRTSRANLIKVVDKYWDVVTTSHNGYDIPYDNDCSRFENGANVSWEQELNDTQKKQRETDIVGNAFIPDAENGRIWGCARESTLSTRSWTAARNRNYVVDEERGLVMSFTAVETAAGGMMPGMAGPPVEGMNAGSPPGAGGMGPGPGGQESNPLRPSQIGTTIAGARVSGGGPPGMSTKSSQASMQNAIAYQAQLNWIVQGKIKRENAFYHVTPKSK